MKSSQAVCLLLVLFFGLQPNAQSQDRFYSQIFANRLQLSPALAGSEESIGLSITTQARWQWIGIENHVQQYGGAYHSSFYTLGRRFGYGLNYQMERTADGGFTQQKLELHFSHTFEPFMGHFFSIGIAGGIQQQALDFSVLRFPPQLVNGQWVQRPQIDSIARTYRPDFQMGLSYFHKNIFAVATIKHLQDMTFADSVNTALNPFYSGTVGFKIALKDSLFGKRMNVNLTPFVHYQRQGRYYIWMLGMNLELEALTLSARYTVKNRWSGGIAFQRGPFQIAYQYDYFSGNIDLATFGHTHELSLKCVLDTGPPNRRHKIHLIPLPKF
ncbi:MAG: PorP/SprF family type IX secretion system membrane protein [Bacteroidia bacterium]